MRLSYTPEQKAFRAEVRAFIAENLPAKLSTKVRSGAALEKADYEAWHAILNAKGWLAANWPVEHGGTGWDAVQRFIFDDEATASFAPRILPFGPLMLAPVLLKFGTQAQCAQYLPRILDGTDWWCQGYSEPNAGSDLASLQTRAVRDGDHYIVNGQKTWTTLAQHATHMFCLVRTRSEGKPQAGISFLLIDMASPGVELRPIELLDGSAEVNEVWLTDVRVPVANLVGEENRGWDCAKYLLTHERTNIAGIGFARAGLAELKRIAQDQGLTCPVTLSRIAQVEIDLMALETTNLRLVSAAAQGQAPGPESSMLKVKGTVIRQEITALIQQVEGAPSPAYLNNRKLTIYGGSNEVQRQIIAKTVLGL